MWHYGYDHNNRLVVVERQGSASDLVDLRVNFEYDPLGNRTLKSVDADGDGGSSATVTKFGYDRNGNAWADINAAGAVTMRRFYADAVDALFARMDSSGDEDWYLTDRLGSVRDLIDNTGTAFNHLDWDSYGKLVTETGTGSDRYGWTSRERDVEIELQYNRARYYDWDTGRWISQDPIGFDAGDSNLSRYVSNSPVNSTDPSGLLEPDPYIYGPRRFKGVKDPSPEAAPVPDRLAAKKDSYSTNPITFEAFLKRKSATPPSEVYKGKTEDVWDTRGLDMDWSPRFAQAQKEDSRFWLTQMSVILLPVSGKASFAIDLLNRDEPLDLETSGGLSQLLLNNSKTKYIGKALSIGSKLESGLGGSIPINSGVMRAGQLGGSRYIYSQPQPYTGALSPLNSLGLKTKRPISMGHFNRATPGTALWREVEVHEAYHTWITRNAPGFRIAGDTTVAGIPFGAPFRYLEEVGAYAIGHAGSRSARIFLVPLAPFEAFGSLSLKQGALVGGLMYGGYQAYNDWPILGK